MVGICSISKREKLQTTDGSAQCRSSHTAYRRLPLRLRHEQLGTRPVGPLFLFLGRHVRAGYCVGGGNESSAVKSGRFSLLVVNVVAQFCAADFL